MNDSTSIASSGATAATSGWYERRWEQLTEQISAVHGLIGLHSRDTTPGVRALVVELCDAVDVTDDRRTEMGLPSRGEVISGE